MNAGRLMNDWTLPIYAFFEPIPAIEYHDKHNAMSLNVLCMAVNTKSSDTLIKRHKINQQYAKAYQELLGRTCLTISNGFRKH
ncbi:hypothetical protein DFJ58DRAFT_667505 [Suillus subalutaceus]|uniref:uncharacterized protein n=1 Tax=Suillus subalutaceus TaxID=48586 RepID=UPI001B8817BE|nr:uncharacterized protein DFJ58DRAFT_667505 [Suillus subalutaceus]KAG1839819.1 hypothetical protein DFJ58DRAFT_667505 [Suillus subalutaceus]